MLGSHKGYMIGGMPVPVQPLPWEYFRRMPQRQLGKRHLDSSLRGIQLLPDAGELLTMIWQA